MILIVLDSVEFEVVKICCFTWINIINYIQVVPGRAGGGSFKRKKNHIAEKEFAYRMCAR